MRQIIAMGGGGFSEEPDNLRLDRYVIAHARRKTPTVCFVPTASGDSDGYIVKFYAAFVGLDCRPIHLSLFRQPKNLEEFVAACDVIYVGGGNTRNMLAVWHACGFNTVLRQAWTAGVVLCGISAGAICWFRHGQTDSSGTLGVLDGLGFIEGSCVPHYDSEPARRSSFHSLVVSGEMAAGYGLEDGAAIHIIDEQAPRIITSRPNARAFHVHSEGGKIVEELLHRTFLENV